MARRRTDLVKAGAPAPLPDPSAGPLPGPLHEPLPEPPSPDRPEDVLALPPDARDISAELAAPPRRRLPWGTLLLAACVVAALGFTGGVLVGKQRPDSGGTGFSAARGGGAAGGAGRAAAAAGRTFGGRGAGGSGGAAGTSGGLTVGTVKLVDGSTVYVSDPQGDIVKVTTGKSTTVSTTATGKVSDLKPGQTVTVRGTSAPSGDLTATTITEGGPTSFFATGSTR